MVFSIIHTGLFEFLIYHIGWALHRVFCELCGTEHPSSYTRIRHVQYDTPHTHFQTDAMGGCLIPRQEMPIVTVTVLADSKYCTHLLNITGVVQMPCRIEVMITHRIRVIFGDYTLYSRRGRPPNSLFLSLIVGSFYPRVRLLSYWSEDSMVLSSRFEFSK